MPDWAAALRVRNVPKGLAGSHEAATREVTHARLHAYQAVVSAVIQVFIVKSAVYSTPDLPARLDPGDTLSAVTFGGFVVASMRSWAWNAAKPLLVSFIESCGRKRGDADCPRGPNFHELLNNGGLWYPNPIFLDRFVRPALAVIVKNTTTRRLLDNPRPLITTFDEIVQSAEIFQGYLEAGVVPVGLTRDVIVSSFRHAVRKLIRSRTNEYLEIIEGMLGGPVIQQATRAALASATSSTVTK